MLRAAVSAGTPLGQQAKAIMESGGLVSDDIIVGLVKERILESDCENGCLFDGFPRTIPQAQAMVEEKIGIDHVLEIAVEDDEIINRLSGRRVHPGSGRVYHVVFNPPNESGVDDETGEPLIQREDDREETVRNRLAVYHDQTQPLVNFYRELDGVQYHRLDGVGAVDDIANHITSVLGR